MGSAAEICAREYKFSREDQDNFAIESYTRAKAAVEGGKFVSEIAPIQVPVRGKDSITVSVDEDYNKINFDKLKTLKPAFEKDGTITAANASNINDGATALLLMSEEKVKELGLKPIAKILAFADAAHAPEWFTTAPSLAIPKALRWAGLDINDIDYFELNEAFAVVGLVNNKILGLDDKKVNVYGGAVALGHPIGNSGARIVSTLATVLKQEGGRYGVTGICNGGGGASAIVIESI
jgi:acetyl-CoA C-acetyltransferase